MIDDEMKSKIRRTVKDARKWFVAASDMLADAHRARDGGAVSKGLATFSAFGTMLRLLLPDETPRDQLVGRGYKPAEVGLGNFFCERLMSSDLPRRSASLDSDADGLRFVFWDAEDEPDAVAAVYKKDRWSDGPFVKGGRTELLASACEKAVWHGSDLMVGVGRSLSHRGHEADDEEDEIRAGGVSLELATMKPPGVYIGEPGTDWFVERLRRHGNETRSMLLVGATGAGKSTLGRLIARQLHDNGRVLKISSRALKQLNSLDVVDLVVILRPDVLLLDDVSRIDDQHRREGTDDQMLELFEALHGKARLVIATLMNHRYSNRDENRPRQDGDDPGENYYGGCRPGRIDEVVFVKRPSPRVCRQILLHYLGGEKAAEALGIKETLLGDIVERCRGLAGAYLGEVAHRLKVHGIENYKSEIKSVVAAAPKENHNRPHFARRRHNSKVAAERRKAREARLKAKLMKEVKAELKKGKKERP